MTRLPGNLLLRSAEDADADALIGLVGDVYAEYEGCVLDLEGVDANLTAPATAFEDAGGHLWVVEDGDGTVVGCVGWTPTDRGIELKRLYVGAGARGQGVGTWLVRHVEAVARERGGGEVDCWSDTRFADAHRLYERLGYERLPETRDLHDPSHTTEYHFVRTVPPRVVPVDASTSSIG